MKLIHCWPPVTCGWDEKEKKENVPVERCHSGNYQQMHLVMTLFFFFILPVFDPKSNGIRRGTAGVTRRLTLGEWCLSSSSHRLISRASHNRHRGQRCCVGGVCFVFAHYVFPTNQIKTRRKEKPDTCLREEMVNFLLSLPPPLLNVYVTTVTSAEARTAACWVI